MLATKVKKRLPQCWSREDCPEPNGICGGLGSFVTCANIPPAVSLSFKQFEGSLNLQTLQHCYMGNPTLNRFKLRIRWAIWMLGGEIVTIAPNRWISEVPKLPEKKTWKNSPAWLVWCLSVGRPHNVHLAHSITQMLSYVLNC